MKKMKKMKKRRRAMLEDVMGAIGDSRWDLIVNDYHKGDEEFDYAIVHAGTGKSMNRIHLGDYDTSEMLGGLEDCDDEIEEEMLSALDQTIIDELEARGQYAPYEDECVNVYNTAFFEEEEGDKDECC